ncbi:MAG: SAM-dependent methyltransferase [Pyrinomonadaceae bacterium]
MRIFRTTSLLALCVSLGAACGPPSQQKAPTPTAASPNANTATPAPQASASPQVKLDVPYVPTPTAVVDEMLKIAKVRKTDVLYDLGSGDGRIPVTAAQRFGTRGVGIDINPQRISEANENAQKAGVTDRVKFIQGDLFQADIGEATVVTLYLLPEVNLRLRPKLLRDLKPGTRVVSHNYDMGDWKPAQEVRIDADGSEHVIYYWVVPAGGGAPAK